MSELGVWLPQAEYNESFVLWQNIHHAMSDNLIRKSLRMLKTAVANKCLKETTEDVGTLNINTANTETRLLTSPSLQAHCSYKLF